MAMRAGVLIVALTITALGWGRAAAADAKPLWRPVADEVYLQEVGRQVPTATSVEAVAACGGRAYAWLDGRLHALEDDALEPVPGAPAGPLVRMKAFGDALWLITDAGLHRFDGAAWTCIAEDAFVDLCMHRGGVVAASASAVYRVAGGKLEPMAADAPWTITRLASYAETVYVLGAGKLALIEFGAFNARDVADWGALPSETTRDMLAQGSRLLVATDQGVGVLRGTAWTALAGADGLPYEDALCLEAGFARDYWIGTPHGAVRAVDGAYHLFAARRWLPAPRVNDIACSADTVYIATDKGLGLIQYEPYTLLKKAAYYERHLEEWGQKRVGFTHKLEWDQALGGWVREVSDNDVGWSTHYLAAQCFKYAVTGDPKAKQEAATFFHSMKLSEEMSSIPGFPARSLWGVGETGHKAQGGSGGYPAEWHPVDGAPWEWKGDTSSDETDAHFYAASIYYELVAEGVEKARVRQHLHRIASHIYDNGWILRDVDGKPTVWARWNPEYFDSLRGRYARGLNGLEILSYMRTAAALTGDAKFEKAYRELLGFGYHTYVLRQKLTAPPGAINHSDDRLAFYAYYPLLNYETDPELRGLYRRSLERSYEIERIEHIPWFNFIYGALTGNECETAPAVEHLRAWPLDLVDHPYAFKDRKDLATPPGYTPYAGCARALSPREIGPHRWTSPAFRLEGGGGRTVVDPAGWLDAYWMGRYYGFIEAPKTDDPALLSVPKRGLNLGAKPYDGPPLPELEPIKADWTP